MSAVLDTVDQTVLSVAVTVSDDGDIRCVPRLAVVTGSNVLITFNIQSTNWVFPDTDAVVVTNGGTQFPYAAWTVTSKQVSLLDLNTDAGTFGYTVYVTNTTTGEKRSLDPSIKNDN